MSNFELAIPIILKHEGGFADDKTDPGGATNFGISLRYLKTLGELGDIDGDGDVDYFDVKNMTRDQAIDFYKKHWWDKYNYTLITDQEVATKVFDTAVNMGHSQAIKLVQRACNSLTCQLVDDGILGVNTLSAINQLEEMALLIAIKQQCVNFYLELIKRKPEFIKYKYGWLKRAYS